MNANQQFRHNYENATADELDEIIDTLSAEVDRNADRAVILNNLSVARKTRFERIGNQADLDGAINAARAALELTPTQHQSDRLVRQLNLGSALLTAEKRAGNGDELKEAIALFREISKASQSEVDNMLFSSALANLCQGLQLLAEHTGQTEPLVEALAVGRQAVQCIPSDSVDRPAILANYANALRIYADQTDQWANLDSAIEHLRQAVDAARFNDSRRLGHLSDLAMALSSRFELRGELIDLEEAIATLEEAVEHTPTYDARLPGRLTNLATYLSLRFERMGSMDDLRAACRAAKASVEATYPDDPRRPGRLSNLGSTLMAVFHAEGNRDRHTIDEAILAFREALDTLSADHSWRSRAQTNLGNALRSRAYRFNDLTDLSDAFRVGKEAVEALPPGHPHLALGAYNLAMTLRAVHTLTADPNHLNAAIRLAYSAASDTAAHVTVRVMAAEAWGDWCAMQAPKDSVYAYGAADGYAVAVSLLPVLAWRGLHRPSQERALTKWSTLPVLAAAYATESNRVGMALELLELGRAVLWSQVLELRSDLDDLRQVDAELAGRLSSLRQRLDGPADGGGARWT